MEIRTTKRPGDTEAAEPAPDTSRYLRRKPAQKVRRGSVALRRLAALVPPIGKFAFLAALGAFLFSIFNYAYTSNRFSVRAVKLVGCKQLDSEALAQRIRAAIPSNVLQVDLYQVRAIAESDPWVKRAEIRRVLPSDVIVYVQERVPSVLLEIQGELMLSDDEGILLDRYSPKYGKLDAPVFKGLLGENADGYRLYQEENSARVALGRKMLEELESGSPAFSRGISEVDLSDRANVQVLLVDDTAEILLGDRDFLKRFRMFVGNVAQYHELKEQYEIVSIDLRFDGQIVYRPRAGTAKAVPKPAAAPSQATGSTGPAEQALATR
jgi:cell division protein FtsQ